MACVFVDWLNANAGAVTALATVVLVGVTAWYACHTRGQLKEMKDQVHVQTKRAIGTIVTEIKVNHFIATEMKTATPFLDAAYPAFLWAVSEAPLLPDTWRAIADACASVKRFNANFDVKVAGPDARDTAHRLAGRNIQVAVDAIAKDSQLLEWLGRANTGAYEPPAEHQGEST